MADKTYDMAINSATHAAWADCFSKLKEISENRYTEEERQCVLDVVALLYVEFGCHVGECKIRDWVRSVMDEKVK